MRVVIAVGGNALGSPDAEAQRANVRAIAPMLAAVAHRHQLVLTHGSGGLLEAIGAVGYVIEQELGNLLTRHVPIATVLTMTEVDPADPAFADPATFVGPAYDHDTAERLAAEFGWIVKPDGGHWRRVVPSPEPKRIVQIQAIRWLLDKDAVVICAGGGIPTMRANGSMSGVEAVIDKDLAGALLARDVNADLFVMATDIDGVYRDWGTETQRRIEQTTPDELRGREFAPGSMGPKVTAAIRFVDATGNHAAIGALTQIESVVDGTGGTQVNPPDGRRN